jgi:hypothetical protein
MKFNVIEFPSRMFSWSGKVLTAEASDLGNRHLQPLYDDACDVGFAVKSEHTGEVVTYAMGEVKKDAEGELISWEYTPTTESERKVPACRGTKAIIFND